MSAGVALAASDAAGADASDESHATILARYLRHLRSIDTTCGNQRAWHIMVARGLYSLMADIECDGGEPAPMGMPHVLTLSAEEVKAMVQPKH